MTVDSDPYFLPKLDAAVRAVCPAIDGVTGLSTDRTTWAAMFQPGATSAQRQAAQNVLASFDPSVPTSAQAVAQKLANGIAITSTGTPALNATYALDQVTQQDIVSIWAYIKEHAAFPAGMVSLPFPDINGALHSFPTPAQFVAFATACADIVTQIKLGVSPMQSATIP